MQVEIDRLKRFWTIARRSELLSAPPTCSSDRGRTRWTASVLVALRSSPEAQRQSPPNDVDTGHIGTGVRTHSTRIDRAILSRESLHSGR